jgi:predicted Rossmann fold nucleotide-binding protein DprA/Smf involved in DNA uptake
VIEAGGSTIGVVGTPLDKAYPIENAPLQETIYREHLLISARSPSARARSPASRLRCCACGVNRSRAQ